MAAGAHKQFPSGVMGLLCREHFPCLITLAETTKPVYKFELYVAAADAPDLVGTVYGSKAEQVMMEFWVSLPSTKLLNTSHSLHFL